jgi:hypothetical protein
MSGEASSDSIPAGRPCSHHPSALFKGAAHTLHRIVLIPRRVGSPAVRTKSLWLFFVGITGPPAVRGLRRAGKVACSRRGANRPLRRRHNIRGQIR